MKEYIKKRKAELEKLTEGFITDELQDEIYARQDELNRISSQLEPPVKSEIADGRTIKWFMELALKMREDGYSDASIYSIDTDAWGEYRVNDGLTPGQAIKEEESNG